MRKVITTQAGEIIDQATCFVENMELESRTPVHEGHWERLDYTTRVYEDGIVHPKYCQVYLPWCYDPEDHTRRYNVLYYQHGNTCEPDIFVPEDRKKLIDNLFDTGEIEPCIIVATTYYFDTVNDLEERKKTGSVPAGDGNWPGVRPNFTREIVEDIIPAVETKYHTYLTDPSPEGIIATRDHRAFSGYSRGAVATWRVLHEIYPCFRWYAPMSCMTTAGHSIFDEVPEAEVIEYITAPLKEHPELPCFIYASNGYPKDVTRMTEQMKFLTGCGCFSYGTDPEKNNLYFALSNFSHTDLLVPYYYYNSLQVLFR